MFVVSNSSHLASPAAFAAQLQIALAGLFQRDTRGLRGCQTSDFFKRAVDFIMEARIQQWINYKAVFCDSLVTMVATCIGNLRANRSSSVDFGETAADVDPSESSPTFSECVAPKDEVRAG